MTADLAHRYARQRADITALARDLDAQEGGRQVPACPDWQVRELVSHLAAIPADVAAGRLEGAGTAPWTARQVAERQGRPIVELLAEWDLHAPALEAQVDAWGLLGYRVIFDVTMHGDDLREALGLPLGATEDHAFVLDGLLARAGERVTAAGLPAVSVSAGDRVWTVGEGPPASGLRVTDPGELARVFGGRRSLSALRGLDWTGDPEPYLPHLPLFAPPAEDGSGPG